jgi:hypothetical protein
VRKANLLRKKEGGDRQQNQDSYRAARIHFTALPKKSDPWTTIVSQT